MKPSTQNPFALPVYVQVSEYLIRDIAAGRLAVGTRLPPERDMAKEFDISVGTLRKALKELAEKGYLESIQGSGNYIRQGAKADNIYAMFRLELPQGGGLPSADVLSLDYLDKSADLPEFGSASKASRIRRMRYLNETIIAVEEIWLDGSVGKLTNRMLSDSLYQTYQKNFGLIIGHAEDRVSIGQVPEWAPDHFTRKPHETVGFIQRFSWATAPDAIEFSRTWFDPNRAVYVQRLN